jgi:ATP/maltotriose-dependent transcriptional regulator MalT
MSGRLSISTRDLRRLLDLADRAELDDPGSSLLVRRLTGQNFTERDCLLLTLIYPRLAAVHAAVLRQQVGSVNLTQRQWQVMHLIAVGCTNRQIASRLGLSEGTVRTHCEHIFQRLRVTNRVAAVARAFGDVAVAPANRYRDKFGPGQGE